MGVGVVVGRAEEGDSTTGISSCIMLKTVQLTVSSQTSALSARAGQSKFNRLSLTQNLKMGQSCAFLDRNLATVNVC